MASYVDPAIPLVPTEADKSKAADCLRLIAADESGGIRLKLEVPGQTATAIELPAALVTLLRSILTEFVRGNAVTALPVTAELTTRQAADLLNVSRPYLIGLLEQGRIPFRRVGTHRRVNLADLMKYKTEGAARRSVILDELVELGQEFESDE